MKTKVIFLLFVFGAVAVLAEKVMTKNGREDDVLQSQAGANGYVLTVKENFRNIEKKINEAMKKSEGLLEQYLDITDNSLNNEQKKAQEEKKNKQKIEKCLEELGLNLREEVKNDMEDAEECITEATDKARKILQESRKALTEIFVKTTGFGRSNDYDSINGKVSELNPHLQKTNEALKIQKKELEECTEKFKNTLKQVEDAYFTLINQCKSS